MQVQKIKKFFPIVITILALLSLQCSHTRVLSDAEKIKLDPPLLHLLEGTDIDNSRVMETIRADGSREYAVIVRSEHPEEITALGIPVSSVFGDAMVVHATKEELRKIVSLPSVRTLEAGSKRTIQRPQ